MKVAIAFGKVMFCDPTNEACSSMGCVFHAMVVPKLSLREKHFFCDLTFVRHVYLAQSSGGYRHGLSTGTRIDTLCVPVVSLCSWIQTCMAVPGYPKSTQM